MSDEEIDEEIMGPIRRASLSERVFSSIIEHVQEHGLRVGDKLPTEGEFAELFQVSRTSVREAMKALSVNGAVASIPGKGTFVCQPMLDFILNRSEGPVSVPNVSISQLMEVRIAVEVLAAELAVERATDEDIDRVAEAMDDLRRFVSSQEPWAGQGASFHVRIAESAKNPLVVGLVESYAETAGRYRDAMLEDDTEAQLDRQVQEHEAILDALRARDRRAMCAAVRAHLEGTAGDLQRLAERNAMVRAGRPPVARRP